MVPTNKKAETKEAGRETQAEARCVGRSSAEEEKEAGGSGQSGNTGMSRPQSSLLKTACQRSGNSHANLVSVSLGNIKQFATTFRAAITEQALPPWGYPPHHLKVYKLLGEELVGGECLGKSWNLEEVRR